MVYRLRMNRLALMIIKNFWRIPGAYGKLCYYAKHTESYPEEVKYKHIQYILKLAVDSGHITLKTFGKENIPEENGFMMYANHQGMFDIIALAVTCDKPWAAVMKQELYKMPLLKQMAECTKSLPMDRENIRQSMSVIQTVTEEVKGGRNYLIFPEGTRSKNGNHMAAFHGGSFKCALKAKCPIVPIALVDSFKVLDQKGSKPVTVQIHFLNPIPYEEYQDLSATELAKMVQRRIEKKVMEESI